MPGAATITQFQGQTPPWSLVSLDANFTALNALAKDVGNYTPYIIDAGGANAYSCTYGVTLTFSLATGVGVTFKAANANTGSSTLNVNATGIKNILNVDGSALTANQIVAGGIYTVVYDGTQYQLLNPTSGIVAGNSTITGNLVVKGNTTLGDAAADTLDIGGQVRTVTTGVTYDFFTRDADTTSRRQVRIVHVAGADRYITLAGSNGGNPTIDVSAGNLAITPNIIGGGDANIMGSTGADAAYKLLVRGTARAVRFGTTAGSAFVEAVDQTGSGSYQPLVVGGSSVVIQNTAVTALTISGGNVTAAAALVATTNVTAGTGFIISQAGAQNYLSDGTASYFRFRTTAGAANIGYIMGSANGLVIDTDGATMYTQLNIGGAEKARLINAGYFKASNSANYLSATGQYHEFDQTTDSALQTLIIRNAAATATNQYGAEIRLVGDPNDATRTFISCVGNATVRLQALSNGGLANFSANNVNLCSLSVKKDFTPLAELPGMLDLMWQAHRELDWAQYRYKDQTHEEFNYGPSAERVHELFTKRGIPLTDAWQPEKMHTGAVTIGGLSYDYAVRGDNPDSPLGITGDFAYVTGAMVSYAQKRIERIEAALMKAKLL